MIPQQVYDIFIQFEDHAANMYLDLAVRFADQIELSWFWVEMAMEEKQHAGLLQYCRQAGMFTGAIPDSEQIQCLAGVFKDLERRVGAASVTVDEAFEIAIDLERSEINDIFATLTANLKGPWRVVQKKAELSADNHLEHLLVAARQFGVSPKVQHKLAALTSLQRVPDAMLPAGLPCIKPASLCDAGNCAPAESARATAAPCSAAVAVKTK